MKILIVTDAWAPQMNGVVRTLEKTVSTCRKAGHIVEVIAPSDGYFTMPLPTYPDIRLAPFAFKDVERRMIQFAPEAIHIATEGPLGQAASSMCQKWELPYTTSYHTKFPEYIKARFPFIPLKWPYDFVRKFHNNGGTTMVTTKSMQDFLIKRGFTNLKVWARGVDLSLFNPSQRHDSNDKLEDVYKDLERPIFINVGRVAIEKNIKAFLDIELPGSKVVIGDGPQLEQLKKQYPNTRFLGSKFGEDLARHFADSDVFVFPSLTDTFGLVNIEAMATGTPVAAFPVSGPIDIIPGSNAGIVDEDLQRACLEALKLSRQDCVDHARKYSWESVSDIFVSYLTPQYKPTARKKWRRIRRLTLIASSPYHLVKIILRRTWRLLRGKSVPKT